MFSRALLGPSGLPLGCCGLSLLPLSLLGGWHLTLCGAAQAPGAEVLARARAESWRSGRSSGARGETRGNSSDWVLAFPALAILLGGRRWQGLPQGQPPPSPALLRGSGLLEAQLPLGCAASSVASLLHVPSRWRQSGAGPPVRAPSGVPSPRPPQVAALAAGARLCLSPPVGGQSCYRGWENLSVCRERQRCVGGVRGCRGEGGASRLRCWHLPWAVASTCPA